VSTLSQLSFLPDFFGWPTAYLDFQLELPPQAEDSYLFWFQAGQTLYHESSSDEFETVLQGSAVPSADFYPRHNQQPLAKQILLD